MKPAPRLTFRTLDPRHIFFDMSVSAKEGVKEDPLSYFSNKVIVGQGMQKSDNVQLKPDIPSAGVTFMRRSGLAASYTEEIFAR